jgi:fluoride ion exporter CrcB/FEX
MYRMMKHKVIPSCIQKGKQNKGLFSVLCSVVHKEITQLSTLTTNLVACFSLSLLCLIYTIPASTSDLKQQKWKATIH